MEQQKDRCRVEVFSRVTGFFRPVREWNDGKQEEFRDRGKFQINKQQKDGVCYAKNEENQ